MCDFSPVMYSDMICLKSCRRKLDFIQDWDFARTCVFKTYNEKGFGIFPREWFSLTVFFMSKLNNLINYKYVI